MFPWERSGLDGKKKSYFLSKREYVPTLMQFPFGLQTWLNYKQYYPVVLPNIPMFFPALFFYFQSTVSSLNGLFVCHKSERLFMHIHIIVGKVNQYALTLYVGTYYQHLLYFIFFSEDKIFFSIFNAISKHFLNIVP